MILTTGQLSTMFGAMLHSQRGEVADQCPYPGSRMEVQYQSSIFDPGYIQSKRGCLELFLFVHFQSRYSTPEEVA